MEQHVETAGKAAPCSVEKDVSMSRSTRSRPRDSNDNSNGNDIDWNAATPATKKLRPTEAGWNLACSSTDRRPSTTSTANTNTNTSTAGGHQATSNSKSPPSVTPVAAGKQTQEQNASPNNPTHNNASNQKQTPRTYNIGYNRTDKMKDDEFLANVYKLCHLQKQYHRTATLRHLVFESQLDNALQDFCNATIKEYARCRKDGGGGADKKNNNNGGKACFVLSWLDQDKVNLLDAIGFPWLEKWTKEESKTDSAFQKRLLQVANYKKQHGNLLVPYKNTDNGNDGTETTTSASEQDQDLFQWMERTREDEAKLKFASGRVMTTGLTQDRRALLEAMGFEWVYDTKFQQRMEELKTFDENDDTIANDNDNDGVHNTIPTTRALTHKVLGKWCSRMRSHHRSLLLGTFKGSPDDKQKMKRKIELLQQMVVGFHLDTNVEIPATWEDRFQQLLAFKVQTGHCIVPQHWSENKQLGKWVNSQRKYYADKRVNLTQERIDRLEEVGFVWKVRDRFFDRDWDARLAALKALREEKNNNNGDEQPEPLLEKWIVRVREEHSKYESGKTSKLNDERIKALEELGFDWNS